jgi:hypothetical protein
MDNKAKYTLNVYLATKELVLRLIKTYDYKTVDDCISSICNFIEVNKLNPRAIYAEEDNAIFRSDLRMYFEDLRRFLDSRDQSMRKFWGAMEKSYFKPLLSNLVIKNTIEANDVVPPNAPNNVLKAEPMETEKNTSDIQELRQLNSKIDNLKKANKEINDLYDIYKEKLNYLINNVKITSSMTGKDYVEINMSKEEWFKFKNSIPNL